MIDWTETQRSLGYGQEVLQRKRPSVVCRCDGCDKRRMITVRVKGRLVDGQLPWRCPACVGAGRSAVISTQMKELWRDDEYRGAQVKVKADPERRRAAGAKIRQKWADADYRSQIETGVDAAAYAARLRELHGDRFDCSAAAFGSWLDPITVRCRACGTQLRKSPQKLLDYGHCAHCGGSSGQRELAEFVARLSPCVVDDRRVVAPLELDVYVPSAKVAFEYHGLYWHSHGAPESSAGRLRHQRKALACAAAGVRLLQFFDFEWSERRELVQSMIAHALGRSEPRDARSLKVIEVGAADAFEFFAANHLQGGRHAALTLGLADGGRLLTAASFSRFRDGHEIIRMATAAGHVVRGGVGRLLAHFGRARPGPIYTYADLRHSQGAAYEKAGFTRLGVTGPGYFWHKAGLTLSRQRCQKSKLPKLLGADFDQALSEAANMFKNGWRRCWDAGHVKLCRR